VFVSTSEAAGARVGTAPAGGRARRTSAYALFEAKPEFEFELRLVVRHVERSRRRVPDSVLTAAGPVRTKNPASPRTFAERAHALTFLFSDSQQAPQENATAFKATSAMNRARDRASRVAPPSKTDSRCPTGVATGEGRSR